EGPKSPPIASMPMRGTEVMESIAGSSLFFARRDDLFAVVEAAVRAHPVRDLGAVAMVAPLQPRSLELPVGAALAPARRGMSALGYRHGRVPPSVPTPARGASRRSGASARSLVQIGATSRTQP